MSLGSRVNQAVRFVVRNWPLKLAAIALATLLYAGLVASQDSSVFPGPVAVLPINKPDGTVVTNDLRDLDQIRYIAPLDVGRLRAEDFEATVDLANVKPDGQQQSVRVAVSAVDPARHHPRLPAALDPGRARRGDDQAGPGRRPAGADPRRASTWARWCTRRPRSRSRAADTAVSRVVAARVVATLDPEGIDFDRDVEARPVDDSGQIVAGVELDPRTVHVTIPLFTNRRVADAAREPGRDRDAGPGVPRSRRSRTTRSSSRSRATPDQLAALTRPTRPRCPSRARRATSSIEVALALPVGRAWRRARRRCR